MGDIAGSMSDSTAGLTVQVEMQAGTESESFHYTSNIPQTLDVESLSYEVDERGTEWWEKLANFQLPWSCRKKGPKGRRRILNDVTFQVKSGQMLAVLGSSGSGKTSLLDVVACQADQGDITGDVRLGGASRTPQMIKSCAAYVRQDDRLLPHLSVKETLSFVAKLKLPKDWSERQIQQRVDSVISELGLRHVADSKVGGVEVRGISGGERRRVSIGVQLLLDPSVLFLDEPTSGLDSFTAHHLVETLSKLARNNRVILMSIHQPRSDIFELFDLIMLMSQGNMVYFGQAIQMVDHFTRLGFPCPELTNPCDFYVDLTTVDLKTEETEEDTAERVKQLVDAFKTCNMPVSIDSEPPPLPGTSATTMEPAPAYERILNMASDSSDEEESDLCSAHGHPSRQQDSKSNASSEIQETYFGSDQQSEIKESTDAAHGNTNRAFIKDESGSLNSETAEAPRLETVACDDESSIPSVSVIVDKKAGNSPQFPVVGRSQSLGGHGKQATPLMQFWTLIRRAFKNNMEDYGFLGVQAIEAICMALMIGLVYYDLGLDQTSMRDRFGLLYIIGALYPYMIILDVIGAYHRERHVIYYEMRDGLYTESPYFFAKIFSEMPEHTCFIILYVIPMYFLAGLQLQAGLILQFWFITFIIVYCSRSLAYFSAALLPTYQMSVLMAQSIFTLFLLSCGFIFNLENIWIGVKWTSWISYLKWGYTGLCYTEFHGLNFTCEGATQNCIHTGEEALEVYSLDGYEVWHCCTIIVAEILLFLLGFYLALKFISQKPHQQ